MTSSLLYIASNLPSLSETFVYGELFRLRERGIHALAASVHPPERDLGHALLDALADEAIPVYGGGVLHPLKDALLEALTRPGRAARTAGRALVDVLGSPDVTLGCRPKVIWQMLAALALARRTRSLSVSHIHAHMAHVPTTIAMYAARQLGITFSFTGHANDLFRQRTLLGEKLRRASFVACISNWHRCFYQQVVALPDERLPIVRCGVEVPAVRRQEPDLTSPPLILSVGRLVPKKGFDVLIHSVAELLAGGQRLKCQIVGGGPQQAELHALIHKLGVQESVALLGPRANTEVKERCANADLFVLPCRVDPGGDRDGIPVVLMEAMAAGVCVISGDLPAIRELVRHGETGLLAPPGHVPGLTAAIRTLLDNSELRRQLGARGRDWVHSEFSARQNIDRLLAAFEASGGIHRASAEADRTVRSAASAAVGSC